MKRTSENGNDTSATYISITEITAGHRSFARLQELREFYCYEFGEEPQFYVRVPGRVNLIGEHVDYCGYPVLPMAIDQCILLAVGRSNSNTKLDLRNIESKKYENFSCELKEIDMSTNPPFPPLWHNYYLCGIKGIYETLKDSHEYPHYGMKIAVSGNIPPASGVSSSSALVSSAVLATAVIHNNNNNINSIPLERRTLASISAKCERYIGTQGGGMDQAIAYLAKEGCAQFIEFHPSLNATPLQLPHGACFVVANSLTEKNKAATSDFNERVVECRLGCRLIAHQRQFKDWREMRVFAVLQDALACDLVQLEKLAMEIITKDLYTRAELLDIFGVDEIEFEKEFLTSNTRSMQTFKLKQRTLHVIQEGTLHFLSRPYTMNLFSSTICSTLVEVLANISVFDGSVVKDKKSLRLQQFRKLCESFSSNVTHSNGGDDGDGICAPDALSKLSLLMRQSHESLKTLYECSHSNLDNLVKISDELGVGARLTGAGWGGCIVALCESKESSLKYIAKLKEKYYASLPEETLEMHRSTHLENVVFATCPQAGAEIFKLLPDI